MQQKVKTYTLNEAIHKLEQYCAYQERCHKEVIEKLTQMRMIPQAIDVVVTHLIEHNFLNEERFARSFARGKFRIKKWGRNRIQQELKYRDISTFIIGLAMEEIEQEYLEIFEQITQNKYDSITEKNTAKARKKFVDYFLYKGWESHLVYQKALELFPHKW